MSKALITGMTGQDGLYLAELLQTKGYHIVGAVRDVQSARKKLPEILKESVELVEWDMLNLRRMRDVLSDSQPTEVYNFAAYTLGSGMHIDPLGIGEVNGLAVARILEAIREVNIKIKFCQASSREIFGDAAESPQTEATPTNPRNSYGAAKLYADSMVRIYRQHFGLYACSAILFNHESPRRGIEFVTRKITLGAVKIKLGLATELQLGNMETLRDWGFAGDYVFGMWKMLQRLQADDYILATGEVHSVRDFCECAFSYLDLDYRDFVRDDISSFRPSESAKLVSLAEKAKSQLDWAPRIMFGDLVRMMVDADLLYMKENLKGNGK